MIWQKLELTLKLFETDKKVVNIKSKSGQLIIWV